MTREKIEKKLVGLAIESMRLKFARASEIAETPFTMTDENALERFKAQLAPNMDNAQKKLFLKAAKLCIALARLDAGKSNTLKKSGEPCRRSNPDITRHVQTEASA